MADVRRTALHAFHAQHGARFVDFAGWDMPVQYRSILEEHRAVRSAAGLFDVSHMGELTVSGPGATDFLNRLLTNDVSRLKPGRALYSILCREDGGAIDDLIVYCLGQDEFLVCLNASNAAKDVSWIRGHADAFGFTGQLEDVSASTSLLALQGPAAAAILQPLTAADLAPMRPFDVRRTDVAGIPTIVARTGYTGEDGFELFCPWSAGPGLAESILSSGADRGLILCGLGARDSLRTEAGYPLYGHELDDTITPVQAGLAWTVKLQKAGGFIGDSALRRELEQGPSRRVVWFRTEDRRIARPGTPVLSGSDTVGRVLSGTLSPLLNVSIGSALVDAARADAPLEVDLRGTRVALNVVAPPLVPLKKN